MTNDDYFDLGMADLVTTLRIARDLGFPPGVRSVITVAKLIHGAGHFGPDPYKDRQPYDLKTEILRLTSEL